MLGLVSPPPALQKMYLDLGQNRGLECDPHESGVADGRIVRSTVWLPNYKVGYTVHGAAPAHLCTLRD